jgi:hypothetical protein
MDNFISCHTTNYRVIFVLWLLISLAPVTIIRAQQPAQRRLTNEDFDSRPALPANDPKSANKSANKSTNNPNDNAPTTATTPAKSNDAVKSRLRPEERLPAIDHVPANFSRINTRYFQIVNQENTVSLELQQEILDVLENCYSELKRRFGYAPTKQIGVIFYQQQTFFDTTRAPSWAGGLNDGRIHIPVGGLEKMNANLASVLKHELAHSFVYFKTGGNCPTWLNEGLAQLVEGKAGNRNKLTTVPRLQDLPQSFGQLNTNQAQAAYVYGLMAAEILAKNGLQTVVKVLEDLGKGKTIDAALAQNTRYRNLADFNSALQISITE